MSGFSLSMDLTSLDGFVEAETAKVEAAVRPAAQAMSQVLYDAVKVNVAALGRKTGNLSSAIYQAFSERSSGPGHAAYNVSWNPRKAPHGQLVENGFIQRYASYVGKDGNWYTAVRPEMRGKPRPKGRGAQSAKDAYFVLRKGGPVQHPARSFVRSAASQFDAAAAAGRARFYAELDKT